MMKRYALVLAGLAGIAAPLAAQNGHAAAPAVAATAAPMPGKSMGGMSRMSGMMMDSMMPAMHVMHAFAPASLLGRASALELTAEQRARLEQVRARTVPGIDSAMSAGRTRLHELNVALAVEPPDVETVVARFAAAHTAMGLAHQAQLRAAISAMGVLTNPQQVRAAAGRE